METAKWASFPCSVMSDADSERDGLQEGLESSSGDPRVLIAMNAVLSALFAAMLVWGADLVGILEYTLGTVAGVAVAIFLLTYVVVLS